MHKNVAGLLAEVEEILKELSVTWQHRESLLESLSGIVNEYQRKKLPYREYEKKLDAVLKGRTREDWIGYYDSYAYSLLRKAGFIVEQASKIVEDDNSFPVIVAKASPAKAQVELPEQKKKPEAFNIDNEIARLKGLLEQGISQPETAAVVKKLGLDIPELEGIKAEIAKAEDDAKAKIDLIARQRAAIAENAAALRMKASQQAAHKRRFPVRINISLVLSELRLALASFAKVARALKSRLRLPAARQKAQPQQPKAAEKPLTHLISFSHILGREHHAVAEEKKEKESIGSMLSRLRAKMPLATGKKQIFVEDIVSMERLAGPDKKEERLAEGEVGIAFGWFSPRRMVAEFLGRFREKQEPVLSDETAVPVHMRKLREMRRKLYAEERLSGFDSTLLAQEAKRIKRILEVEKQEVYQGSSLGLVANVTVRKISLFFVDNFPQFFGYLYNALRAANVKVLSNTYVNIMVLVTMATSIATFFLLLVFFFIINYPLYQIVLRSVIFAAVAGMLCATIFYMYPFMKIRDRRRKTTTNLPFAINHMSAVATSGVPPARMFELIAESAEYEEVGVEIKKIVDLTNIFGYDLLTAIRTVVAATPSIQFKKFLEGMVSTIETGGDLVSYLSEQADEAELTYKLERQRYNETVSTYSDIYTGVLIAAPLFFIAAMALVNMLGGTLGGLGVGVVMALGAYVVIPLLNIAFILFLQATQPEV